MRSRSCPPATLHGSRTSAGVRRSPWWFVGAAYVLLFLYAAPKLTTEKIEAARDEGVAAKEALKEADEASSEGADGAGGTPPTPSHDEG